MIIKVWQNMTRYNNALLVSLFSPRTAIQGVFKPRRSFDGEAEAAADSDDFHLCPTQGIGESLSGDALSGYIHKRRNRNEDRSHRSQSSGRQTINSIVTQQFDPHVKMAKKIKDDIPG